MKIELSSCFSLNVCNPAYKILQVFHLRICITCPITNFRKVRYQRSYRPFPFSLHKLFCVHFSVQYLSLLLTRYWPSGKDFSHPFSVDQESMKGSAKSDFLKKVFDVLDKETNSVSSFLAIDITCIQLSLTTTMLLVKFK